MPSCLIQEPDFELCKQRATLALQASLSSNVFGSIFSFCRRNRLLFDVTILTVIADLKLALDTTAPWQPRKCLTLSYCVNNLCRLLPGCMELSSSVISNTFVPLNDSESLTIWTCDVNSCHVSGTRFVNQCKIEHTSYRLVVAFYVGWSCDIVHIILCLHRL